MASEFYWAPSYTSNAEVNFNVRRVKFGDGYEQRSADGLLKERREWDLQFANIAKDVCSTIKEFLRVRAGVESFSWETPESEEVKVVCLGYREVYSGPNIRSLTMKFEEVYDL